MQVEEPWRFEEGGGDDVGKRRGFRKWGVDECCGGKAVKILLILAKLINSLLTTESYFYS